MATEKVGGVFNNASPLTQKLIGYGLTALGGVKGVVEEVVLSVAPQGVQNAIGKAGEAITVGADALLRNESFGTIAAQNENKTPTNPTFNQTTGIGLATSIVAIGGVAKAVGGKGRGGADAPDVPVGDVGLGRDHPLAAGGARPTSPAGATPSNGTSGTGAAANTADDVAVATGQTIVVRTSSNGQSVVVIRGEELSTHAARQATNRGISNESIAATLQNQPFSYVQNGQTLRGYYDAATNTFVGVGDRITTVIRPRNPVNYINNLRNRK